MTEGQPFPPYDAPGPDGLPLKNEHVPGIPVTDNPRRLAKDVMKMSKLKSPKPRMTKRKSNVKWY
jgi:hypothetical protein